jgi:imidazolonepropionase-like amidohydrolase
MYNLTSFFDAAYAYSKQQNPTEKNLNLEAMRPVFAGKTKVYFQANYAKDIITAINFLNRYRVKMVLVDGADSWKVTDLLKENNVPVIIKRTQALPMRDDDDIDLPYKLPALLKAKGVDFAITDEGFWKVRNLPFEAGTAVGYGLSKEDALTSITLAPAKILGIDATTGSLEDGKDATLFVSTGDALDMTTNNVEMAFIQGRQIEVFNFQQELYERYMRKYKLPLPNGN